MPPVADWKPANYREDGIGRSLPNSWRRPTTGRRSLSPRFRPGTGGRRRSTEREPAQRLSDLYASQGSLALPIDTSSRYIRGDTRIGDTRVGDTRIGDTQHPRI